MEEKIKKVLDSASEIYLWLYIEGIGGFLWRMNHDLADGRIDSTPGIEKDLVTMRESIEYAVSQLERFGIEDPGGEGRDKYWKWYRMWKKHIEALSDADYNRMNDMLKDNESNPCPEFSPYKPVEAMFFGKKLKELRLKANMGLRKFSETMDIKASKLSNIERGYEHLGSTFLLSKIIVTLAEELSAEEVEVLANLYEEPFVMQKMEFGGFIPHATKRLQPNEEGYTNEEDPYNTRPATVEELASMTEWFNNIVEEHNAKADIYNKENGRI